MDEKSPVSSLVASVLAAAKHPLFEPLVLVLLSLATVATALFCGSTAAKFEKSLGRRVVLTLGLGAFVFAAVRLLQLPVQ